MRPVASDLADQMVARLLSARPDLREEYEAKRREIEAEGFGDHVSELFVSEHTTDLRGELGEAPPNREELRDWLDFFEREWGRHRELDAFIKAAVLVYLPDAPEDRHHVRGLLGAHLAEVVERERNFRADADEDVFLTDLRRRFPELEAYVGDNTYGDHAALLAHSFLADVVRHAVGLHTDDDPRGHARAQEIFDAVAAGMGTRPRVDELIATGFVENLPDPDQPGADIVRRLPPALVHDQEMLRSDLTPLRRQPPPTAGDER